LKGIGQDGVAFGLRALERSVLKRGVKLIEGTELGMRPLVRTMNAEGILAIFLQLIENDFVIPVGIGMGDLAKFPFRPHQIDACRHRGIHLPAHFHLVRTDPIHEGAISDVHHDRFGSGPRKIPLLVRIPAADPIRLHGPVQQENFMDGTLKGMMRTVVVGASDFIDQGFRISDLAGRHL